MFIGTFSELVAVGNTKTLSWSSQTFFRVVKFFRFG